MKITLRTNTNMKSNFLPELPPITIFCESIDFYEDKFVVLVLDDVGYGFKEFEYLKSETELVNISADSQTEFEKLSSQIFSNDITIEELFKLSDKISGAYVDDYEKQLLLHSLNKEIEIRFLEEKSKKR